VPRRQQAPTAHMHSPRANREMRSPVEPHTQAGIHAHAQAHVHAHAREVRSPSLAQAQAKSQAGAQAHAHANAREMRSPPLAQKGAHAQAGAQAYAREMRSPPLVRAQTGIQAHAQAHAREMRSPLLPQAQTRAAIAASRPFVAPSLSRAAVAAADSGEKRRAASAERLRRSIADAPSGVSPGVLTASTAKAPSAAVAIRRRSADESPTAIAPGRASGRLATAPAPAVPAPKVGRVSRAYASTPAAAGRERGGAGPVKTAEARPSEKSSRAPHAGVAGVPAAHSPLVPAAPPTSSTPTVRPHARSPPLAAVRGAAGGGAIPPVRERVLLSLYGGNDIYNDRYGSGAVAESVESQSHLLRVRQGTGAGGAGEGGAGGSATDRSSRGRFSSADLDAELRLAVSALPRPAARPRAPPRDGLEAASTTRPGGEDGDAAAGTLVMAEGARAFGWRRESYISRAKSPLIVGRRVARASG